MVPLHPRITQAFLQCKFNYGYSIIGHGLTVFWVVAAGITSHILGFLAFLFGSLVVPSTQIYQTKPYIIGCTCQCMLLSAQRLVPVMYVSAMEWIKYLYHQRYHALGTFTCENNHEILKQQPHFFTTSSASHTISAPQRQLFSVLACQYWKQLALLDEKGHACKTRPMGYDD